MGVIIIYIYIQFFFSSRNVLIYTEKTNPSYVRSFLKAQIPRALLSDKNGILHFWKKSTIK